LNRRDADFDSRWRQTDRDDAELSFAGVYVPFNLDTLIESIWVATKAPEWFAANFSRLVRDLGLKDVTVNHSHLGKQPFF
jgi:hypothetical protein